MCGGCVEPGDCPPFASPAIKWARLAALEDESNESRIAHGAKIGACHHPAGTL